MTRGSRNKNLRANYSAWVKFKIQNRLFFLKKKHSKKGEVF